MQSQRFKGERSRVCREARLGDGGAGGAFARTPRGFDLTPQQAADVLRGKDFVQLKNGPFDLDLVKDREPLPRLRSFRAYWMRKH